MNINVTEWSWRITLRCQRQLINIHKRPTHTHTISDANGGRSAGVLLLGEVIRWVFHAHRRLRWHAYGFSVKPSDCVASDTEKDIYSCAFDTRFCPLQILICSFSENRTHPYCKRTLWFSWFTFICWKRQTRSSEVSVIIKIWENDTTTSHYAGRDNMYFHISCISH